MRKIISLLYKIKFLKEMYLKLFFLFKNGYYPNFKRPKTFNEKVNYRKRNYNNKKYPICSDKIEVKEYVKNKIGDDYIIPNYFVGDSINVDDVIDILKHHGDCLLKANHNSGPVYLVKHDDSIETIKNYCDDVNKQLYIDFGKKNDEPWYSDITPKVLIEKRLYPEAGDDDIKDYKFHVFKKKNGGMNVLIHVDLERGSNHSRTFFDENFNFLMLSSYVPSIYTDVTKPKNFEKMLEIAKKLSEPFSYVRVDLYNIDGKIFFGELTFAPGSGYSKFSTKKHDLWVGNLWELDPCDFD
ncbi:glycosyltransferase [Photobacterium damselae subsp. damselae]|uniref:ATP-grasp fold amidoligase family protein n=1 Tax=Photobacterium damselae TaxID=38293 RepID=UPI000D06A0E6|nr:ATP-grasp fold amidoligase family protein [Photobacterium damselae]PSB83908.1 glycosyltransferase [Photobacterium damselae subsp. damselae]